MLQHLMADQATAIKILNIIGLSMAKVTADTSKVQVWYVNTGCVAQVAQNETMMEKKNLVVLSDAKKTHGLDLDLEQIKIEEKHLAVLDEANKQHKLD
ncbi:hypothetical protein SARC_06278 [Sphaeroforma arctica JP610]|uniref:Uncharacterized protein n=1 Tax=Sphaeroforma arctica JP610 TaxID=667725 RepID=A0A0L0FXV3_9EUKA|nr:hypothetical protein SARC_06278 [Sphaeroforma arctica JP610]KNC81391.1 hypothetical protein SARC_06278 [Sphaeroforma arctica JP610]|eukprot:XP_014155293.1 hypothetical protein SARC_06278 [Sphaeroforma arctica JP610]